MNEQTLIRAAQDGDLEAFNQLVLAYQDYIYRIALHMLGDDASAADAAQETFLSAFQKIDTFRGASLRSWLGRIVINTCYDELRRLSRRPQLPLMHTGLDDEEMDAGPWMVDPEPSPEAQAETAEISNAIQLSLDSLPVKYRTVAFLVDVEGLVYSEAAELLRVPVGTVKSRLARARHALRLDLGRIPDLLPSTYSFDPSLAARP